MTHLPPGGIERRRHPRFELMAQVRVKRGQVDYLAELSNISMSGVLLHLGTLKKPSWIDIGRVLEIGIVHPITLEPVMVHGKVVRISQDEADTSIGANFADLTDEQQRSIERLVSLARHPDEQGPAASPPPLPR